MTTAAETPAAKPHVPPPPVTSATAADPREWDALVLAIGQPAIKGKVCGLTLRERGKRVCVKAGAVRVEIADSPEAAAAFVPTPGRDLLILRASDQIVHFPLLDCVREVASDRPRIAITPDGEYAGAIWIPAGAGLCDGAPRGDAAAALAMLGRPDGDIELAKQWRDTGRASEHEHGNIARHRAVTKAERSAATKYLFQLIHKPDQDGFLSKYLFRPVAYPITRFFLPTPVTPNGITFIVAVLALGGCVIVAGASYEAAVIGSILQHVAGYFDCTDGEIARLRHEGSRFGQWFDTLTDEATTIAYIIGIGIHTYWRYPEYQTYIGWGIVAGVIGGLLGLYVIYYYLIKVARSGNSQDYPVTGSPTQQKFAQLLHRDLIGLVTMLLAIFNVTEIAFIGMALGGVVSGITLFPEHLQLRRDLSSGKVVPKSW